MDLSQMDDSPVLWIRLDPDMTLIRSLDIIQPDFQWQYQLRLVKENLCIFRLRGPTFRSKSEVFKKINSTYQ